MKPNYALGLIATTTLALAQTGQADDALSSPKASSMNDSSAGSKNYRLDGQLFRANEVSVDLFGTLAVNEETFDTVSTHHLRRGSQAGAGVGVNYFFVRCLGVGGEVYSENYGGSFIDNASANLIFRLPSDRLHLAPYIFGGGGYHFESSERVFAQAGAGIEFRFTKNLGLFLDARCVLPDGQEASGLGRAGVRFAF